MNRHTVRPVGRPAEALENGWLSADVGLQSQIMVIDHDPDAPQIPSMSAKPITSIAISEFKATCLAVLERVRRTGTPVLVTRRGEPVAEIVPPSAGALRSSWLGAMRGTATITGDVIEPVSDPDEWDAVSR
jgi:prevent-host-death family protein